jgi:tetratricopeptide (TPR) repeat protein
MAYGLLGGILGSEDDKPDATPSATPAGAEAFAAAVAAKISGSDPEVARKTVDFLSEQTQLLKAQKECLKDEHALRLAHLRSQVRAENTRQIGMRVRIGLHAVIALVAIGVAIGAAIMIHDALGSRSVVIDAFDIAPNVAAQVPSGKIVAAGLLDVLTRIQAATRSRAEHRSLASAWTNDIAIDVPETGISIGQLQRTMKARFGRDQHIDGDLAQSESGGLALTVRGTGILPKTFIGEARHLDKLLTEAGEYAYGQSQPGLFAAYLANNDRNDEAIRFSQTAYARADSSERPYVLNYWANAIAGKGAEGAMREALPLYREALRRKPDYWTAYNNIMYALNGLGDEEGLVRVSEQLVLAAGGRPGRAPEHEYQNYDRTVWDLPAERAEAIADVESHNGIGTTGSAGGAENLQIAQYEVQMHDVEAATLRLNTTPVDAKNAPDVAQATFVRALIAEEKSDPKTAAQAWDTYVEAYANPSVRTNDPHTICFAAPSYERTGQSAKAEAALNAVGTLTLVDCYRFRGDILELRGDWPRAQAWYAKAVKLAPSIPSGYYSWGVALAKHSDLNGAAVKFKDANQKGPHWADPLKAWGDVLAKQGNIKEAMAKYDEAHKFAPNWKQLKDARDALAKDPG